MGLFFVCVITAALLLLYSAEAATNNKRSYVVQMNPLAKPDSYDTHRKWYTDVVAQSLTDQSTSSPQDNILYTYNTSYHGFAVAMSAEEAQSLRQSNSVIRVYEDKQYFLHTTRTPQFLGLEEPDLWSGHTLGDLDEASQNVIVGVLDTGVWPDQSDSFRDEGMSEVPTRWRGKCAPGFNHCNKKLIGARSFLKGYQNAMGKSNESESPRDYNGHGTHTASTAAGTEVKNASLFGLAAGIARGVAHRSRLSIYKVCGSESCMSSDILAGMNAAIHDGVDVMSLSIGSSMEAGYTYDQDLIAVGAFAAMEKGIFVSCSAGNDGPDEGTVSNVAPWIMTVGASTIDRGFPAYVTLGNGEKYTGVSLYTDKGMGSEQVGLVYDNNTRVSKLCLQGSLNPNLVRGKVVLCDRGAGRAAKGLEVRRAGGVGMIIANTRLIGGEELLGDSHLLPALGVGNGVGEKIRKYMWEMGENATAVLGFGGGTVLNVKPSPMVTAFSSRGPNRVTPQILKPDVIAPGMLILAAWSGAVAPTDLPEDKRRTKFNIISGTSMSCPHVSGLAALLKAAHPKWSPSAIKSALMTTAYTLDNTNSPLGDLAKNSTISTPWAQGSGHVNLHNALAPGLVYNATAEDYTTFLCSTNYTIEKIQAVVRRNITCPKSKIMDPGQLNYPSFSVVFGRFVDVVTYTRELTNVGDTQSIYKVSFEAPPEVSVNVQPSRLVFRKRGDKQRYTTTFTLNKGIGGYKGFGSITWSNKKNRVTSPVSITSTGY